MIMAQKPEDGGNGLEYSGPSLALQQDLSAYDLTVMDLSQFKPKGDLGIIQWPAALKVINLIDCRAITGTFEPCLTLFACPTNTNEQPLSCGPSRKFPFPHPDFCLLSALLFPFVRLPGDLSKVQWPEGLQSLALVGAKVSGASPA